MLVLSALLMLGGAPLVLADAGSEAIAKTKAFLNQIKGGSASAKEIFDVANTIGPTIDEVRQSKVSTNDLETLRGLLEEMRKVTSKRLSAIERDTNDNESELERLYRSQVWDDLSFALDAFPDWRS